MEKQVVFKSIELLLLIVFGTAILISCGQTATQVNLDITAYLNAANSDELNPSKTQIEMLRAVMPKEAFQFCILIYN